MSKGVTPLEALRERLRSGEMTPADVMTEAQAKADASAALKEADCGTYIWRDAEKAVCLCEDAAGEVSR
jgi:hypothetical protein